MSLSRLVSLTIKELLSFLRDPKSRFTLIGPPLLQLFIFSFAATLEVRNVDIALLNDDAGRWSQELIARVGAAGFVDEILPVHRVEEMEDLISRRRVLLALRFPADFSRDVVAGVPARAQVIVDGRRANAGQIALSYLTSIATDLGMELTQQRSSISSASLAGSPTDAAPRVLVRHWFNPNLIYLWFIVPSLSGILAMFLSLIVTALSIARERELGTFDQLLVSPVKPMEIVIGKTVPALIIGTVMGALMIAAGVFVFRIPFTGSVGLLLASLVLFILSVVGIGLMVSSICQTQQQAILGTFSVAIPVILISGFATPVENMPSWLQVVAQASPLKYFLVIVQGTFLKALPASVVFANAWPMAAIALVTLTLATFFVERRLQ
jgi:ABC-2 type transport system permease protein